MAWSRKEVVEVSLPLKTLTDFLIGETKKTSQLVLLVGPKGCGKSWLSGKLGETMDTSFNRSQQIVSKVERIKPAILEQLNQRINGKRQYSVLCLDDFGSELDPSEFSSELSKQASWLYQKDRKFHICSFLTVPDKSLINKTFRDRLTNYLIDVRGHTINYTYCKIYRLQTNQLTQQLYYHRLRYDLVTGEISKRNDETTIPLGKFKIPKPSKEFIEWYEPFRTELGLEEANKEFVIAPAKQTVAMRQAEKIEEINNYVKQVMEAGPKYIKKYGKRKFIDKHAISADFGLGLPRTNQVTAKLKQLGYGQ